MFSLSTHGYETFATSVTDPEHEILRQVLRETDDFQDLNIESMSTTVKEVIIEGDRFGKVVELRIEGSDNGYVIMDGTTIIEYSRNKSPFAELVGIKGVLYYDPGFYGVYVDGALVSVEEAKYQQAQVGMRNLNYSPLGVLPGASHNLQNGPNCQAAALANLFWFWSNHGMTFLKGGKSFLQLQDHLNTMLINANPGGVRRNNDIPGVAERYVKSVNANFYVSGEVRWSPSSSFVTQEIDRGYPLLLGFKSTVYNGAHMTMCYGYDYNNQGTLMMVLADGHKPYAVRKAWSSDNDCAIRIRVLRHQTPPPGSEIDQVPQQLN